MENERVIRPFKTEEILRRNKWLVIMEAIVRALDDGQEFSGYHTGITNSENKEEAILIRANLRNYLGKLEKKGGKKIHSTLRFYEAKPNDENAPQIGYWVIFSYKKMPKSG